MRSFSQPKIEFSKLSSFSVSLVDMVHNSIYVCSIEKKNFLSESLIHTAQCYAKCVVVGVCVFFFFTPHCNMLHDCGQKKDMVECQMAETSHKFQIILPVANLALSNGHHSTGHSLLNAIVAVCLRLLCRRSMALRCVCERTSHGHSSHSNLHTTIIIYFMCSSVLVSRARSHSRAHTLPCC